MLMLKRLLSIISDLILAFLPAFGAHYGGLGLLISFSIFYLLSQSLGIILLRGQTTGTKILRIVPKSTSDTQVAIGKLLLYHLLLTIDIVTIFSSISSPISSVLIGVVLIFPFEFQNKCQSLLDLLFSIHWVDVSNPSNVHE